ncbi:hypothetical protein [Bradyrhizobium sp. SZCCHNR1075]|uniref:hypothetical protein n=1 Tax=Bradyrhizobium sp. SZCCHNR1075 TaxID=3057362 RepID=UPI0028F03A72|nr:hypothetical protein [Bradyrhizobium sp. SZCCHNR1075]
MSEAARRHANHPNVIASHMRRGTQPAPRGLRRLRPAPADDDDVIEDYFPWPDEARRRVILALRASAGQPLTVQADAAHKAAIRSVADYRALKPAPAAIELHA